MSDVFISYANQDRDRIGPLVRALEARGWTVFWDLNLMPGETWRKEDHQRTGRRTLCARVVV